MAKYGKSASKRVKSAMHRRKKGTLKSGSGGRVKSRSRRLRSGSTKPDERRQGSAEIVRKRSAPERSCAGRRKAPSATRSSGSGTSRRSRCCPLSPTRAQFATHRDRQRRPHRSGALLAGNTGSNLRLQQKYDACLEQWTLSISRCRTPCTRIHDPRRRAGVHVLCEKPMAVTADECQGMIEACRRAPREADDCLPAAFRGDQPATSSISCGRASIGEPKFFNSSFSMTVRARQHPHEAEMGGGTLYDIGVYCINAARHLFRAEPKEVMAISVNSGAREARGDRRNDRRACCDSTASGWPRSSPASMPRRRVLPDRRDEGTGPRRPGVRIRRRPGVRADGRRQDDSASGSASATSSRPSCSISRIASGRTASRSRPARKACRTFGSLQALYESAETGKTVAHPAVRSRRNGPPAGSASSGRESPSHAGQGEEREQRLIVVPESRRRIDCLSRRRRRSRLRAMAVGEHPCELRSEEENLGGVVDPEKDDHERAGGAKPRRDPRLSQVEPDEILPDGEERSRHGCANPDVRPVDSRARKNAIGHRKEQRRDAESKREVQALQNDALAGSSVPPHLLRAVKSASITSETRSRKPSATTIPNDSNRDRSSAIIPAGRWMTGARQMRSSALCNSANTDVAPTSRVTRPMIDGEHARARPARARQQTFNRLGAVLSDQPVELIHDFATRGFRSEGDARDRDGDDEDGARENVV